jgi:hypothetical protein
LSVMFLLETKALFFRLELNPLASNAIVRSRNLSITHHVVLTFNMATVFTH